MKVQYIVLFASAFLMLSVAGKGGGKKCGKRRQIVTLSTNVCACTDKTKGTLNYRDDKLLVCNGKAWVALSYEPEYGTVDAPGTSCKDILEKGKAAAGNGIYYITTKGKADSFPVYCDMDAGGYTMVFKAIGGNGKNIFEVYNSDKTSAEFTKAALDVTNGYSQEHYKNRIVLKENWAQFNPTKVRVVLYSGGQKQLEMVFDGKSSDYQNWFSADRLLSSPYTDIKTSTRNYFSVAGDQGTKRYFFINSSYAGCGADFGWLVAANDGCDWEKRHAFQGILYSKLPTRTNWNNAGAVGVAEVLAVYVA